MVPDMLLTQIQETGSAVRAPLGGRFPVTAAELSEICNTLGIPGDRLAVEALPSGALEIKVIG